MKKDLIKAAPQIVTVQFQAAECVVLDRLVRLDHSSRSAVIRKAVEAMAAAHPAQAKPATAIR